MEIFKNYNKYVLTFLLTFCFSTVPAQITKIDSLKDKLQTVRDDTSRLSLLHELSKSYWYIQPDESIKFGEQARQLAEALGQQKGIATALYYLGVAYWVQARYDKALEEISRSLEISKAIDDKEGIAQAYGGMGVIYRGKGDYSSALEFQHKALEIFEETGNQRRAAMAYVNMGVIFHTRGRLTKALDYNIKALKIYEELGGQRELAGIFNNIGAIYNDQENYEEALEYYERALELQQALKDKKGVGASYLNVGEIYASRGQDSLALSLFYQALELYEELEDQKGIAESFVIMGRIFYKQENYALAKERYLSASALFREIGYKEGIVLTLNELGKTYLALKQYLQSVEYASESIETAKEIQVVNLVKDAAETLYQAYRQLKNYEKALEYHIIYEQYKDSLLSDRNTNDFEKLKFNYEIEKKETENILLKARSEWQSRQVAQQRTLRNIFILSSLLLLGLVLVFFWGRRKEKKANQLLNQKNKEVSAIADNLATANAEIEAQKQTLEKVNKAKDKLFSVISHDLRGPLNSLQGLLALSHDKALSQEEALKLFPEIARQLSQSHNLLDNLLVWAKSQMQGFQPNPEKFNLRLLIEEVTQLLGGPADKKKIQIIYAAPSSFEAFADPDMVKLILRNLISNAIKFTPEGGSITISASEESGFIKIEVADTGVGISEEEQQKLFEKDARYSTPGTIGEKGTGLGLQLSKEFVESNGGKIWVKSLKGKGSIFTFTVPAAPGDQFAKTATSI